MKTKITFLLFMFCALIMVKAQDKVYKKDGNIVGVKAVEQSYSVFKYRMTDYPDGPVLWMPLNKISKIEYQNGHVDLLESLNPRMKNPLSANIDLILIDEGSVIPVIGGGYFVTPQIEFYGQIFADFSETLYFAVGPKFHFASNYSEKMISPFIGFLIGIDSGMAIAKMPIGLNLATKIGLNLSLSYNVVQYLENETRTLSSLELGIGWRF
jgi:hypothetical protein